MTKNFDEMLSALPLERQARIQAKTDQMSASIKLAALRKNQSISQEALAKLMHVSQSSISQIEKGDVQLSTVLRYVEALGGKLHISVNMPDGTTTTLC